MWAPLPAAGSYSCEWVIPAASYCTLLNSLKQKSTINHTQTKKKVSGRAVRLSNPGLQSMPMDIQEFVLSCPLLKYFLFCKWDVPASSASLLPHQLSAGYNTESGGL